MEAVAFLAQYPIRLVQDFDIDRRIDCCDNECVLKCMRLTGDGPGFFQKEVVSPEVLPRGDIFLDLGNQNWVPLYPFIIASNCPRCRYKETYFVDRWNDREDTALMKSFERGHTEDRDDVSEFLTALASGQSWS
jgi:hypothetical protein